MGSDRGRQATELVREPTEDEGDRAVRFVIRWAKRHKQDVTVIGELCADLGLDLGATLRRDGKRRRAVGDVSPVLQSD